MTERRQLTFWTRARDIGEEGLIVDGLGSRELEERIWVSANGMERECVIVQTTTCWIDRSKDTWQALDAITWENRNRAWREQAKVNEKQE